MASRSIAIVAGCIIALLAGAGALLWHPAGRTTDGRVAQQAGATPAPQRPDSPPPERAAAAAVPPATTSSTVVPLAAAPPVAAIPSKVAASEAPRPTFDIVRTEPSGETIVAGRTAPAANVVLTVDGQAVARATADESGAFVLLPDALKPGAHALALQSTAAGAPALQSAQTVAVSVPGKGGDKVVVALQEPNRPTVLLADPTAASEPAAGRPVLSFKTAEVQADGNRFYAAGVAPGGGRLRLYLNGTPLRDLTAPPDGHWSVAIGGDVKPGPYTLRADALDGAGKVTARAEVPFSVPQGLSASAAKPPAELGTPTATVQTATVERGDNLWVISRKALGQGKSYTRIYAANNAQIRDPGLIYPGQVFVLPNRTD